MKIRLDKLPVKHFLNRYRERINPPYSKRDYPTVFSTILLLLLTIPILLFIGSLKTDSSAVNYTATAQTNTMLPNLVENPSFEEMSIIDGRDFPSKWQTRSSLAPDSSVARTGSRSLKATGTGGYAYTFSRGLANLKPNTTYTMQVWVKNQSQANRFGVGMRYPVTKATATIFTGTPSVTNPSDWTLVSQTFTTPADYQEGRLDLTFDLPVNGVAWFDDVYMCEGTHCNNVPVSPTQIPEVTIAPTTTKPSPTQHQAHPTSTPIPTPVVLQNQPTLLESYALKFGQSEGGLSGAGYYNQMIYKPRQFTVGVDTTSHFGISKVTTAGKYTGWDLLNPPFDSVARYVWASDYITLNLNRPAQLAIVWRAPSDIPLPTWLSGWTKSENVVLKNVARGWVETYPTYTKSVPAGVTKLGGIYNTSGGSATYSYLVLVGEQNGTASKEPTHPSDKQKPLANQTCPTWVHDQYVTTGPDGKTYATWHQQIDPVYWCYFRHEHGANPDNFVKGYKVAYNYTATKQGHQHVGEGHPGFKTFVFDTANGQTWIMTWHIGTGSLARVCNRFHSVDVAVRNTNSSEILADVHLMADFGQVVHNDTSQLIQPPTCPTQGIGVLTRVQGGGQRRIPVATGTQGYEPWVIGTPGNILGLSGGYHVNTHNPMVICDTITCANPYTTGSSGAVRFLADASNLKFIAGKNTGTFYTDPFAKTLLTSAEALVLKQYIKPGLSVSYPANGTKCFDAYGWGRKQTCAGGNVFTDLNRENSLKVPN